MISAFADPEYRPEQYYYTDAISDHAVRYIAEHQRDHADKPFFMYVAFTAAHWPMHALPGDIAKYDGRYDLGYAPFREARLKKSIALGLLGPETTLSPQAEQWEPVANKEWEAAGMEVYAAMIDRMDQGIGRIVSELKRTGEFENTLVMFLQDNGACAELMGRSGSMKHPDIARPDHPTLPAMKPADLTPGITPTQTRDGYPVRMGKNAMPGPADTYIAYGRGWANVSNTPFREYKHWVHEGGISSPLVMSWPAATSAENRGKIYREAGHLIDLMATCIDVAQASFPATQKDQKTIPPEGVSLRPALSLSSLNRPNPIFWEHEGNRAVRTGHWKLVSKGKGGPLELYNIDQDRIEAQDLAKSQPDRVQLMSEQWEAWAERALVKPWPWEMADPNAPSPAAESEPEPKERRRGPGQRQAVMAVLTRDDSFRTDRRSNFQIAPRLLRRIMQQRENSHPSDELHLGRRAFLGALAAGSAGTALARDFGPNAEPVRYPDPDIVVMDPRFEKYKMAIRPSSGSIQGCCGPRARPGTASQVSRLERHPQRRPDALAE